ncbi:DUF1254 domain-containing protein [Lutimonas sp.]|uniref:DUF1254 domain-containing protein n=1 Tax=Lutimonas sp. TaxID=1872403 RepID=UPI003D9BC990
MKNVFFKIMVLIIVGFVFACKEKQESQKEPELHSKDSNMTDISLLKEAYLYGYPILTMYYTQEVCTNVEANNGTGRAPLNQWGGMHEFPKAGFTAVVRPNTDTYYSLVYADLSKGPLYLYIPATKRYYLIPILNAFGDVVASVGSRTTGQDEMHIAFVGPAYDQDIPDHLTVIRSNTSLNWVLGRVAVKNNEDGKKEVANFQSGLICRPLKDMNVPNYKAPKGKVDSGKNGIPMDVVDGMDITTYFNEMMALMVTNPPTKADEPFMRKLKTLGIVPGGTFDMDQFSEDQQSEIREIPDFIQKQFAETTARPKPGVMQNGWTVNTSGLGNYGTDYALRAYVTKIGFGANTPEDAIYPNAAVDVNGEKFNGTNKYILHFDADKLPPVKGFWSVTMYDKNGFLVDNSIERYELGSMKDMIYNEDGSLDIYIQSEAPEGREANWLPSTVAGQDFELTFRMYWPDESVINRTWQMPGVQKVK